MMINLFEFQRKDVEKLSTETNVLIANEMGTGKTYEAIALDAERRKQHTTPQATLVVAPLSVLPSWANHFRELQPELNVIVINTKKRLASWAQFMTDGDVLIVNWDVLRLMPELTKIKWLHVIADECHRAQNKDAKQTKALKKIKAYFKTGLSGTPVTNKTDKMWSILNWLYPKEYTSYWRFFAQYVDWEMEFANGTGYKKVKGPKNVDKLHAIIEPFYVRHLKKANCCELHPEGVLPQLPEKYFRTIEVELDPKQRRAYNSMRDEMVAWIGEQGNTPLVAPVVIAQLTRLQQFAIAYAERSELQNRVVLADPSSKIDALMDIIEDTDEQIVVFSQFSQMIKLINKRLEDKGISHVSITGDVDNKLRGGIIDRFQNGKAQVFTGTIAAGGVGITLTSASTVVFTDRSWSPALNQQAEDRCHRIGQQNAVQIIDIMAKDTVDLGRQQRLVEKWSWIAELLGDKK